MIDLFFVILVFFLMVENNDENTDSRKTINVKEVGGV